MEAKHVDAARVFKALCDENRLAIVELLGSGEKCVCELNERLAISQSTLSHHLKTLCESGLVEPRQEGKWTHYSLSEKGCARAKSLLDEYASPSGRAAARKKCV